MAWLFYLLAALVVLDAFRLRTRSQALSTLPPSEEPVDPAHRFLLGPGVTLDEATRRAASAHARRHGLTVLDVWPADLSPELALGLLSLLDVPRFRKMRLARGFTAGQAMLVHVDVLERARLPVPGPRPDDPAAVTDDPVAFLNRAVTLKRFACTGFDFVVSAAQALLPPARPLTAHCGHVKASDLEVARRRVAREWFDGGGVRRGAGLRAGDVVVVGVAARLGRAA